MSLLALLLVLGSAITHIYWNAEVKRARQPEVFSFLLQVSGSVLAIITALCYGATFSFPWQGWACIAATGVTYGAYYTFIAKSYERGDLSLAYPVIRGTAPVFTIVLGLIFFKDMPSVAGFMGIALICFGVLTGVLDVKETAVKVSAAGILLAIITGLFTAIYTTIDKAGASVVDPLLYMGLAFIPGSISQYFGLRARRVKIDLHFRGKELTRLLLASCANTYGYAMFLTALVGSTAAYVVSVRSVGVVLSLVVGALFLKEPVTIRRALAACAILAGIVAITFA